MDFDVKKLTATAGYDPSLSFLTNKEKENLSRLKEPFSISFYPVSPRGNGKHLSTIIEKALMMEKIESMFQSITISDEQAKKLLTASAAGYYSIDDLEQLYKSIQRPLLVFVDETPPTLTPDMLYEDGPNRFDRRHQNEKWKDSRYKRPRNNDKKYF